MKVPPPVASTLGDMKSSRAIARAQAIDLVKKKIQDVLNNALISSFGGGDPNVWLMTMIWSSLLALQQHDVIRDFVVQSVEVTPHKPFREVDCLPLTAKPGDPLIVDHVDENGDLFEIYRGIIISTDGEGNGIVFSQPAGVDKEGQVLVRCSIRPTATIDSIAMQIRQEY